MYVDPYHDGVAKVGVGFIIWWLGCYYLIDGEGQLIGTDS